MWVEIYKIFLFIFDLKMAMQGFTQKIVQMMKNERLFASQGGPIILSQVTRFLMYMLVIYWNPMNSFW